MKRVMSVSLGDPARDYVIETEICGERVRLERHGTGGDLGAARRIIEENDGCVDAFGLGGVNLEYILGARRYPLREGRALRRCARVSPVADGARVKAFVEPMIVDRLQQSGVEFRGRKAVISSALDRWHLAVALEAAGCRVGIGDAALALGLPVLFSGTRQFESIARLTMPFLRHVPLDLLYPRRISFHGGDGRRPTIQGLLARADILVGDSYLLWKGMPRDLEGKVIVLSTATRREIDEANARGASIVASLSPDIEGRSCGANAIEAVISAFKGQPPESIPRDALVETWRGLRFDFRIEKR